MEKKQYKLGELKRGVKALITCVSSALPRLLEMGLVVGSRVEIVHEAPFGSDPIAVRVRGTLIALRRSEANAIEVQLIEV